MDRIVIVGGGFAGLNLAKKLTKEHNFHITLVDRNNYHFFPPLLYQVGTAFIEPSNISHPFRRLFQGKNIHFYMGSLVEVIPASNTVVTDSGELQYDILVLAMGTETNFFGNEKIEKYAFPMKNIDEALSMRNHILLQLERASRAVDKSEKEKHANIVIAGGGPTGVELAGMMAEMSRNVLEKDYPGAKLIYGKIYLIDGLKTLLAPMSQNSQAEAKRVLEDLGVQIILDTLVQDYDGNQVSLSNGKKIITSTLIWASGVTAKSVPGLPKESFGRGNRLLVDDFGEVMGQTNIFAIGDQCINIFDKAFPSGHPQLAQVAIQQGKLLAENLIADSQNLPRKAFVYNDKGSMAIIAKFRAVVDLPKGFFKGFLAWLIWLFIHIIPIAGFRNKVNLAFSWLWSFITNDPTLRLIIRAQKKEK